MGANQLVFSFPEAKRRGGARRGRGVSLAQRICGKHPIAHGLCTKAHPVHVTLRAGVRSLRTQRVAHTLLRALRDSNRDWFRVVHYSLQDSHLHLIVETEDSGTLSSGLRGCWCELRDV